MSLIGFLAQRVASGTKNDTVAIQKTLDACAAARHVFPSVQAMPLSVSPLPASPGVVGPQVAPEPASVFGLRS